MTKYRKECSFRERKIFIRKEHFITLLSALNSFQCYFIHVCTLGNKDLKKILLKLCFG